jgi:hypothetical protein
MYTDVFLSVGLAILTLLVTGYLGMRVSLHPANSQTDKTKYKTGFLTCAGVAVLIVGMQSVRNVRAQHDSSEQIKKLQANVDAAKGETETLRHEMQNEVARRQQAERDLAVIIQTTGKQTRVGVAEDIRKSPINIQIAGQGSEIVRTTEERKEISAKLTEYMLSGMKLRERCKTDPPDSPIDQDAQQWFDQAADYIREKLGADFMAQFINPKLAGRINYVGVPEKRQTLFVGIDQRIETISKFLDEVKVK